MYHITYSYHDFTQVFSVDPDYPFTKVYPYLHYWQPIWSVTAPGTQSVNKNKLSKHS